MDMLLYGGLIPSRLHHEEKETLLERIKILKEIRESNKNLIIYAFQVIMRCPDYSSDDEEPDYYRIYGKEINELGVAVHKSRLGIESDVPVKTAMEKVDPKCLDDYISRREINRYMNVETLQMARDGLIDALVIPQDDSSKYGYAAIDQKEIREKISEYNMEDKVLMYPGADEVELTLLARMLNVLAGRQPKVYVKYTSEMAKNIIPLYEGCTLANTVKYHILSAGCLATESYESADIVLFMTAPAGGMEEAMEQPSEKLEYCVERNIAEMFELLKYCISQKKIVTIADNAYSERESVQDIVDDAERRILEVAKDERKSDFIPIGEAVQHALEEINEKFQNKQGVTGLSTGFAKLDAFTSGFQKGDFIIIAARHPWVRPLLC